MNQYQVLRAFYHEGKLFEKDALISEKEFKKLGEAQAFIRNHGAIKNSKEVEKSPSVDTRNYDELTDEDLIDLIQVSGLKMPKDKSRNSLLEILKK